MGYTWVYPISQKEYIYIYTCLCLPFTKSHPSFMAFDQQVGEAQFWPGISFVFPTHDATGY